MRFLKTLGSVLELTKYLRFNCNEKISNIPIWTKVLTKFKVCDVMKIEPLRAYIGLGPGKQENLRSICFCVFNS